MNLTVLATIALFIGSLTSSCKSDSFKGSTHVDKGQNASNPSHTPSYQPSANLKQAITRRFSLTPGQSLGQSDIIFLVDTSGSMIDEKKKLEQNIGIFLMALQTKQNLDFQVFLVGTKFSFPSALPANFKMIEKKVGSNNGLAVLYKFLAQKQTRPNVNIDAIFITDDNAEGRDGFDPDSVRELDDSEFKEGLQHLKLSSTVHIHGLVGKTKGDDSSWCTIDEVGTSYINLAKTIEHSGTILNLCQEDWSELMAALASNIVEREGEGVFNLGSPPDLTKNTVVKFNSQLINLGSDVKIHQDGRVEVISSHLKTQSGQLEIQFFPR